MYKIGAVLVDENTNGLSERLKSIRDQMKEEAILVNYFISLENVDRFQVQKIKKLMEQYHIDTLILHGTTFDLLSENRYFDLIMKLDAFQIPYHFPSSEVARKQKEAFLLYDEHLIDMVAYCNEFGINSDFQFRMSEFASVFDQEYLFDTMDENELDYLLLEHADQYQSFFDKGRQKRILQSRFEVLDPVQHVSISDQIVEECGCMKNPIKVPDNVVLITETVTKENLQWITQNLDKHLQELDYNLIDYMEAGAKGLCQCDRDHLYELIEYYQIDQIIVQKGIRFRQEIEKKARKPYTRKK